MLPYQQIRHHLEKPNTRRFDPLRFIREPLDYEPDIKNLNLSMLSQKILLREIIIKLMPYWYDAIWIGNEGQWPSWINGVMNCITLPDSNKLYQCIRGQVFPWLVENELYYAAELALRNYGESHEIYQSRILQELVALEWLWTLWYQLDQNMDLLETVVDGARTIALVKDMLQLSMVEQELIAFIPQISRQERWWLPLADRQMSDGEITEEMWGYYLKPPSWSWAWRLLLASLPIRFKK